MYYIAMLLIAAMAFAALTFVAYQKRNRYLARLDAFCTFALTVGGALELFNHSTREEIVILAVILLPSAMINASFLLRDKIAVFSPFYYCAMRSRPSLLPQDDFEVIFSEDHVAVIQRIERLAADEMLKSNLYLLWKEAFVELRNTQLRAAMERFQALRQRAPLPEAQLNLAAALLALGDVSAAEEKLIELEQQKFETLALWHNLALTRLKQKRYTEAEHYIEKIDLAATDHWKPLFLAGRIKRNLGEHRAALTYLTRASQAAPWNERIWIYRALLHGRMGQHERSLAAFDRALLLAPNDPVAWYNRGNVLVKIGDNLNALRSYDKALEINPGSIRAWNNKGIALSRLGRIEEAIDCYKRALSFDSRYTEALLNCALALDSIGQSKEAAEFYRRFLRCSPIHMVDHRRVVERRLEEIVSQRAPSGLKMPSMKVA